jgi:uncharacterized protein (TIGR03067 family)
MKISKWLLSATILVSFTVASTAEAPRDDTKDEMKKLEGMWQVTKFIDHSEKAAPADEIAHFTFEFKGDRLTMRKAKDDSGKEMKFTLDASRTPKAMDIQMGGSHVSEGIYKLDGDQLTICIVAGTRNGKAAARPSEFKASNRDIYSMFILKKVKK